MKNFTCKTLQCYLRKVLNLPALINLFKQQKFRFNQIVRVSIILFSIFFGASSISAQGVPNPNEATWNGNGYSLKKIVSNTSIPSGVNFSYTIMFTAPAGATTVTIFDEIPSSLHVVNVPTPANVNGITPTVTTSGTPGVNEKVSYSLNGLPAGMASSGSFTIVVKFPEGVTCDGTGARNRAAILIDDKPNFTPFVSTSATAENPWKVTKSILAGPMVNPNGGTCGYIIAPDDTVKYRLSVLKKSPFYGNVVGQQNMSSALVTDVLPPGAVVVSSTCGIAAGSTGTITWNPNSGNLNAATPYAYYYCDIEIYYPATSFPIGSFINNQLELDGTMCNQQVSDTSNETCIEVVGTIAVDPDAYFRKYLFMTNRVPGCDGYYRVSFKNTGNVPLTAFDIEDVIPSGITVNKVRVSGASATTTMSLTANSGVDVINSSITNYFDSGPLSFSVNNLQWQMTGSLPVGNWIHLYIHFTVAPNPTGTIVENCATFNGLSNGLTLNDACVTFTVDEGAPRPCVVKDVCSPETEYEPGDIVRFRIRVQNIGSADITGATFQDNLHSNFTYVGNESYYVANTYNVACSSGSSIPAGTTALTGVTPSHSGNNLSWSLPDIPSDCQLFYTAYCGYYGTYSLPYYFVEFDAMVDSAALPGVTPNSYEISGGNLTGPTTSNTTYTLVVASFGQEVQKQVSTDGGTTFSSTGTVAPGGTARYRLNYKNTSNVPLSSLELVDLLPMDDGANDWLILNRTAPRGSTFGVVYNSNHSSSLSPAGTVPAPALTYAAGANICLPPFGISAGCNPTSWTASPDQNINVNYGTFSLASNVTLREDFDVTIPTNATNQQTACNDFAALSTANFLLDGTPQSVTLTPIAAPPVCVTVDSTAIGETCCDSVLIEQLTKDPATGEDCCVRISTKCEVKEISISVSGGTISSAAWNCGALPSGYVGQTNFTFPANGCAVDLTTCFKPDKVGGTMSVGYSIVFANGEKCEKKIEVNCEDTPGECCESVKLDLVQDPDLGGECCASLTTECEVDSVTVNVLNGTIAGASWNCGVLPSGYIGQSSYTFNAANCVLNMNTCVEPDSSGVVSIHYVIYFANGEKCEKRIQMDCKAEPKECCDKVKLEQVSDAAGNECCAQLITDCEVKSIQIDVNNGTISNTTWNCGTVPAASAGQSSYTFDANGCKVEMTNCFDATVSGPVTVDYVITFANGETCRKTLTFDCKATVEPSECCPIVDFKLKQKWPYFGTQIGSFSITNPDPSSPICSVSISASPSATFATSGLVIDGSPSSQPWNSTSIPASGSLTPSAANTINFNLISKGYKGTITVCVVKCDGTKCCYDFNWNKKPIIDIDVEIGQLPHTGKLLAVTVNPVVNTTTDEKVKYISFGMSDEQEIAADDPQFFAISAAEFVGDEYPDDLAAPVSAYMSKYNAFFELGQAKNANENLGAFNLVFSKKLPKLGCTLFNEEGNILFSGDIDVAFSDSVNTSAIRPGEKSGSMFEFIKLYPNPANGSFNVQYATGTPREVEIRVINPLGQVIQTIQGGDNSAGVHNVRIDTYGLSRGLYKVVLYSEGKVRSKSVVMNK